MINPGIELHRYLEQLMRNYMEAKALYGQIKTLFEWVLDRGPESIQDSEYFFEMVYYSFRQSVILELYKLLSKRENKSLVDWLSKAKESAPELLKISNEKNYHDERFPLNTATYRQLVSQHLTILDNHSNLTELLEQARDKRIAHADKDYFFIKDELQGKNSPTINELDILMESVEQVLTEHYKLLFNYELGTDLVVSGSIDSVLIRMQALASLKSSKEFKETGILLTKYMQINFDREF